MRADSIFGSKEVGGDGSYRPEGSRRHKARPRGGGGVCVLGWGLLALAPSQGGPQVTFRVRSAVGKDMWERPMALWMWWSRRRMGMLGASPAWTEGHGGTPAGGGATPLLPGPSLPAGPPCFGNRSTAGGQHAGSTARGGGPSSCLSPFPQTVKERPWKFGEKYSTRHPSCHAWSPPAGHRISEKLQSKETCLVSIAFSNVCDSGTGKILNHEVPNTADLRSYTTPF